MAWYLVKHKETLSSPTCSTDVKNAWSYTSTPAYVFMVWYLVKHRSNFTFAFTDFTMLRLGI